MWYNLKQGQFHRVGICAPIYAITYINSTLMNALKKYLMCEIFKINFLLIYNVQTKSYTWEEHPDEQTDHTSTLKATLDHTQFYFTRKRCV